MTISNDAYTIMEELDQAIVVTRLLEAAAENATPEMVRNAANSVRRLIESAHNDLDVLREKSA